ncbi:AraC-like DNA-binding protein [Kribbella sp. VKM Ac-2571]|uniref:helix-turn-helix domain-containing protein n=1 Tax=Kribbella sp. VKM Ac-2571 TaxID=2512222 RepID=UPI00105D9833|nr:AraC family transcriptional regulator [Kribbella sp. VKM Ac-2571]TDO45647.1 AraC-like DNA-binding protein [Kribbella sp. VKM Ac-2571]
MHNVLSSEVFPDPRLPVAGERLEVFADVAPHSHAFFEIAVVVAGRGTHVSAAGEVALAPDSVVVLRPGEWHGYVDCEDLVVRNAYLGPDVFGLLSGALVPGSLGAPAHPAVQHAMRVLESDLAEPWTLDQLAARVNLAPGYLIRLFGKSVGLSPMAYLNRIRAERAAGLLIETELPVSTIGTLVGWHDPSHATRRFRSTFGLSPTRYRSAFRP